MQSGIYWTEEIKEKRAHNKLTLSEERRPSNIEACPHQENVANMSPAEIRSSLKAMGIITRVRNPQKLQSMFCEDS